VYVVTAAARKGNQLCLSEPNVSLVEIKTVICFEIANFLSTKPVASKSIVKGIVVKKFAQRPTGKLKAKAKPKALRKLSAHKYTYHIKK
jgi:hypothetical protein